MSDTTTARLHLLAAFIVLVAACLFFADAKTSYDRDVQRELDECRALKEKR